MVENGLPPVTKLCVVGTFEDEKVLNILKERYSIDVFHSPNGLDYINRHDIVFCFQDFECPAFDHLNSLSKQENGYHHLKFIGSQILRDKILKGEILTWPKMYRPIYCEIMSKVILVLANDVNGKRRYVDYGHYMGAQVRKVITPKTNVVVSSSARPEFENNTSVTSNARIVTPSFITSCWEKRNEPHFDPLSEEFISQYSAVQFSDLSICIMGFTNEQLQDMTKSIEAKKGKVVADIGDATHIICNPDNKQKWECIELEPHQRAVTHEWIWTCVHGDRIYSEQPYTVQMNQKARSAMTPVREFRSTDSKSSLRTPDLDLSGHSVLSNDLEVEPTLSTNNLVTSKKYMACQELLVTEQNYLSALGVLLKFRDVIEEELKQPGNENMFNTNDIQMIFSRIQPIVDVHTDICNELHQTIQNWRSDADISKPWIARKYTLNKVYSPYLNNYEIAKKVLEDADSRSPRFHAFLKTKESNAEFKRNSLKELLIRPVQRLPSVILLFREIYKRDNSHKNKGRLKDAIEAIDFVLTTANNVRKKNDACIQNFSKFNDVENVPAHLVTFKRTFVCEADVFFICGGDMDGMEKKMIRFMLFNDVIVVCKVRTNHPESTEELSPLKSMGTMRAGGTMHRLSRQSSIQNLIGHHTKRYRYVNHIPISFIRTLTKIVMPNESTDEPETVGTADNPVYALSVRGKSDLIWVFQPFNNAALQTLFDYIQQQISMDYNRDVVLSTTIEASELMLHDEIREPLTKFVKRQGSFNSTISHNTTIHRPSFLRKAISSASMTVSNRFKSTRVNSRSNMESPLKSAFDPLNTSTSSLATVGPSRSLFSRASKNISRISLAGIRENDEASMLMSPSRCVLTETVSMAPTPKKRGMIRGLFRRESRLKNDENKENPSPPSS